MKTATKIRLLNYAKKVFPTWAIERQARVIEHAWDSELKQAKNQGEREDIYAHRRFEAEEYWGELAQFRSRKLTRLAQKLYIHLDNLEWETGNYGHRVLSDESERRLYHAVREERQKVWEFRLKVITAIGSLLLGLIGALIGLVSVAKR